MLPPEGNYAAEAWLYDQLANYYKYSDPKKHMEFYIKHYEAMQKVVMMYRQEQLEQLSLQRTQLANIRLLHALPNSHAVDVYINNQLILENVSFKQYSSYISLPQGQYRIDICPIGMQSSPLLSALIPVLSNYAYTLAVAGNTTKAQLLSFVDSTYLPYGGAKIRFIHLSPDASVVDLVMKDDTLFSTVSFKQATEFLQLSPGIAHLEVRTTGTNNVILPLADIEIEPNKIYSMYIVGFVNKEPKLEAIFLTN